MTARKYGDKDLGVPLSEEDIENEISEINKLPKELTNRIFKEYSQTVNKILMMALSQADDEYEIVQIEQLKRIMALCPIEEKFIRSKDKIWKVRKHLITKDYDFFVKRNYSKMIKEDGNQSFLITLVEIVKSAFIGMSDEERDKYWVEGARLLNYVAQYKKAISGLQKT